MAAEFFDQLINLVPDDLITVHQFFIQVIQNDAIANPALIIKVEEYSPSANKRFNISVKLDRKQRLKLFQQLALASRPFHKRRSPQSYIQFRLHKFNAHDFNLSL